MWTAKTRIIRMTVIGSSDCLRNEDDVHISWVLVRESRKRELTRRSSWVYTAIHLGYDEDGHTSADTMTTVDGNSSMIVNTTIKSITTINHRPTSFNAEERTSNPNVP